MKVKIKSLADGGGFSTFTPIIRNAPSSGTAENTATTKADEKKSESEDSIIDENMVKFLYSEKGGLVNDVNKLVEDLIKIERSNPLAFLDENNRELALRIAARMNEVASNKEAWKESIRFAQENKGYEEAAIDVNGRLFVKNGNSINQISLSAYKENPTKYNPLTVAQLMYERQYNPSLTGKNELLEAANNAIGLEKISDHIKAIVGTIGSEKLATDNVYSKEDAKKYLEQFTGKKPTESDLKALEVLNKVLSGPEAYTKITTTIDSERNHIDKALKYIWTTLPKNAQHKLTLAAINNNLKSPTDYILDMLEFGTDYSKTETVQALQQSEFERTGGKPDSSKISLTPVELAYNDRLAQPGMIYSINGRSGLQLDMTATSISPLYEIDNDGGTIGPGVMYNIMFKNNYQSILNMQNAYIGDVKIDPYSLGELAYSGEDVAKVYAPVRNGAPDLGKMEAFQKIHDIFLANKKAWTPQQAEKFFANNGFPEINIRKIKLEDGQLDLEIVENNNVKPFLAIPVLTNSASALSDIPWMIKLTGDKAEQADLILESAFTVYGGTASKPTVDNKTPGEWYLNEKPYKGVLMVEFRKEAAAILSATFGHIKGNAATELDVQRNLFNSSNNTGKINANADLLNYK